MVSIKWNFHCTPTHTYIDNDFSLMQEIFATILQAEEQKCIIGWMEIENYWMRAHIFYDSNKYVTHWLVSTRLLG